MVTNLWKKEKKIRADFSKERKENHDHFMMLVDCFDGVPLFFVGFVFVKGQSTQLECTFAAQKKNI